MRVLEPWHLVILAVVFLALFGAKRLPDSARSLGQAMHIFKKSLHEEHPTAETVIPTTHVAAAAPPPVPAAANGTEPAGVRH